MSKSTISIRHGKLEHQSHAHLFPSSEPYASEATPGGLFGGIRQPRDYPSRVRSPMLSAKFREGFALSGGGENMIRRAFRLNGNRSRGQSNRGAVLQRVRGKQYLKIAVMSRIVHEIAKGGFYKLISGDNWGKGSKCEGNDRFKCCI
jgi:hypothetical protein